MVQTEYSIKVTKEQLLSKLVYLYQEIIQKSDEKNATKVLQLLRKLRDSEYMIGFCGHFSAGKSSMINELIGENILPSSPIPTSANLVKVKTGDEYARVYYKQGDIIEYTAPYDYGLIKSYCKDGDTIDSIEISHQNKSLPNGVTIMDTPGIDSTDDAHRVATESALHLADLLLYVMDYNHVQSEVNLQFTKDLADRKKPLYLVINQIDKHREQELEFDNFKKGVKQAFLEWNVVPEDIFYTSIRDKNNDNNQLPELKKLIAEKIDHKDELLIESTVSSIYQIIDDHLAFLDDFHAKEKESYERDLSSLSFEDREAIHVRVSELTNELEKGKQNVEKNRETFLSQLNDILDNAYLMPFTTRDLARSYIEACQIEFKIGLFFSKAKTDKERNERLKLFYEDFQEKVSSQLEWHIKEFASKFLKKYDLHALIGNVEKLTYSFNEELLARIVKKDAGLTGDYILTYTSDVAHEVKKQYRLLAMQLLELITTSLYERMENDSTKLQDELKQFQNYEKAFNKLINLQQAKVRTKRHLVNLIAGKIEGNDKLPSSLDDLLKENIVLAEGETDLTKISNQKVEQTVWKSYKPSESKVVDGKARVTETVSNLLLAKNQIESITGLSSIARDMAEKANRLENRQFTVALFGAFSAGKSSFANALMGDFVLPVSPNPTTATINKIVPPTTDRKHGTVIVKVKSESQLLQDIQHSLHVFNEEITSISDALRVITNKLTNRTVEAKEKPHYAFLQAVNNGYSELSSHLGKILTIDVEGFKEYVANEEKACFVEWIELYFDCELTRQGITLVDTPGADSINARHTGVAFDYIKNADAILFVTYYNHAFSKADREFLIQLGRVKDTFSMDKMFFIINAADLANDKDELLTVEEYVGTELVSYGIRKPRLYSLSSQLALKEKIMDVPVNDQSLVLQSSGIKQFESDFKSFIVEELTEMAIISAYSDIDRATKIIQEYISSAKEDKEIKLAKLDQVKKSQVTIQTTINSFEVDFEKNSVQQEIEELTYYIKQRVFLRYPDLFKESFNPSVLREDGRDMKKALQACLQELLESIGYDLAQEMRATSLRTEKFIFRTVDEILASLRKKIQVTNPAIQLAEPGEIVYSNPEFESGLQDIDKDLFKKALSIFKNAKSFFEKNDKKYVMQELENNLQAPISAYLEQNKLYLQDVYLKDFSKAVDALKERVLQEINEYFEGSILALSENVDVDALEKIAVSLAQMKKVDQ